MSEISEKARAEAEEVEKEEAEEAELEEEEAEEAEPEAEPDPELSSEAVLQRDKSLESEAKRHETRLATLHGAEEWELYNMCPLCIGDGFLVPWSNGELPDEQFAAITALAGHMPAVELIEDSDYQGCTHCGGAGETRISEPNPRGVTKQCDKCLGSGYVPAAPKFAQPAPLATLQNGTEPVVIPSNWGSPAANDQWGRAAGHPHYGIDPAIAGLTG